MSITLFILFFRLETYEKNKRKEPPQDAVKINTPNNIFYRDINKQTKLPVQVGLDMVKSWVLSFSHVQLDLKDITQR